MIYCLIGASASGKSVIERRLTEMGFNRIISHTTRPMREKEVNGVDYHFVSEDKFQEIYNFGLFDETAKYREWNYGISLDLNDYNPNDDYIAVVTIHGYMELLNKVGKENIVAIHIYVSERERVHRQLDRGDDLDEVIRRIHNDRIDFDGIELIRDHVVDNEGQLDVALVQMYNIIKDSNAK